MGRYTAIVEAAEQLLEDRQGEREQLLDRHKAELEAAEEEIGKLEDLVASSRELDELEPDEQSPPPAPTRKAPAPRRPRPKPTPKPAPAPAAAGATGERVLDFLRGHPKTSGKDIAAALGVDPAEVSKALGKAGDAVTYERAGASKLWSLAEKRSSALETPPPKRQAPTPVGPALDDAENEILDAFDKASRPAMDRGEIADKVKVPPAELGAKLQALVGKNYLQTGRGTTGPTLYALGKRKRP